MGHAFHQLYYHFTWSTRSRAALIRRDNRPRLFLIINEEAKKLGGRPIRHNAMPDHVHLLVDLPPTVAVSDFIGRLKGSASHRFNEEVRPSVRGVCSSAFRRPANSGITHFRLKAGLRTAC